MRLDKSPSEYIDLGYVQNTYRVNVFVRKLLSQSLLKNKKDNGSASSSRHDLAGPTCAGAGGVLPSGSLVFWLLG